MSKNITRWMVMAVVLCFAQSAMGEPLWGVDEDDGQLFSIDPQTFAVTDFGQLQYNDGGSLADVGKHIEAFTIDPNGIAYMAMNSGLGGFGEPVLLRMDLNAVSTVTPNVVDVIGGIDAGFSNDFDNISGLAFDANGSLLALLRRESGNAADDLLVIDKDTGSVLDNRGRIENGTFASTSSEDMAFDADGNLYVTDNRRDRLYRVDPVTAAILELVDANERGGLGTGSLKIEAIAFDPMTGVLLGADDDSDQLVGISLATGGNVLLADLGAAGLTDVESLSGMPTHIIPEPASVVLGLMGFFMIVSRRPRRPVAA